MHIFVIEAIPVLSCTMLVVIFRDSTSHLATSDHSKGLQQVSDRHGK